MERKFTGTRSIANLRKAFLDYKKDTDDAMTLHQLWQYAKEAHPNHPITKELDDTIADMRKPQILHKKTALPIQRICPACAYPLTGKSTIYCTPCSIIHDIDRGDLNDIAEKYQKECSRLIVEAQHVALKHPDLCLKNAYLTGHWLTKYPKAYVIQQARLLEHNLRENRTIWAYNNRVNGVARWDGMSGIIQKIPHTKLKGTFVNKKLCLFLTEAEFTPVWIRDLVMTVNFQNRNELDEMYKVAQNAMRGDVDSVYNFIGGLELQREYERQD